jgi:putative transposase
MQQSMNRKGDCWDSACAESFVKNLKTESTRRQISATREQARAAISKYIEVFFNRERLHSYLEYCTPVEYEAGSRGKAPRWSKRGDIGKRRR